MSCFFLVKYSRSVHHINLAQRFLYCIVVEHTAYCQTSPSSHPRLTFPNVMVSLVHFPVSDNVVFGQISTTGSIGVAVVVKIVVCAVICGKNPGHNLMPPISIFQMEKCFVCVMFEGKLKT